MKKGKKSRKKRWKAKALTLSDLAYSINKAETTTSGLIPMYVDPAIVDATRRWYPLFDLIVGMPMKPPSRSELFKRKLISIWTRLTSRIFMCWRVLRTGYPYERSDDYDDDEYDYDE